MSIDLYFFAGEKSGDLHGEKILQALKQKAPHLLIAGVGGPRMRAMGMECALPMEEFQVMGFVDVFFSLPKLVRQFYAVSKEIQQLKPKAVVTIDYPGFNLRLVRHLKKRNFSGQCIHFICPSVWAWGKRRIHLMSKYFDSLMTILPFESDLFKDTELLVTYVGHPLVERIKSHHYLPIQLPKDRKIVAIFPGSRKKEIERNLPLYLLTIQSLIQSHPDLHFAISVSEETLRPLILSLIGKHLGNQWDHKNIELIAPHLSYELMKASTVAIAKSGTVTLELAIHRIPTVVTYAISSLDTFIARDLLRIRLPYYCLVNIIAQDQVFPELFGPNFTEKTLKKSFEELLVKENSLVTQKRCDRLIELLGTKSTSNEVANEILNRISLPFNQRFG